MSIENNNIIDRPDDSSSITSTEIDHQEINFKNDDEWEDVEPDHEDIKVVDLFSQQTFPDVRMMLDNCKEQYDFDLLEVKRRLGLDFYSTIKLVNYIRSQVQEGNLKPDVSSKNIFDDDSYLIPVLEDDALLFSLDELFNFDQKSTDAPGDANIADHSEPAKSSEELQEINTNLEQRLQRLQAEFIDYRETVRQSLASRLDELDGELKVRKKTSGTSLQNDDDDYYHSYSYKDIHELMLKDKVRTDAYRDFIYDNKHVFKDKIVLDVGCGTGILSMFCAKAGSKKVFAVDNSAIIDKARQIVYANGLGNQITCLRGKIEEVKLPEEQVDIIVSEWMGYCLLYEAMLDSVIWARDRYLKRPGGVMVPSHCSIHLAPLSDPDFVTENVDFWRDVYGFDMSAMMSDGFDDVILHRVPMQGLAAASYQCMVATLDSVTIQDLDFSSGFEFALQQDIDSLDGWVLWFDTFFIPPSVAFPRGARAESWSDSNQGVAFTTGPAGPQTHWQSGIMLIKRSKKAEILKRGDRIAGTIRYSKAKKSHRALEIAVEWHNEAGTEHGSQTWHLK